ncbi:hypothetical protein SLEP1_g35184 [Rubroshorea leprosula]|uniref:Uncharacterized protein n=1 Tax=Rubroshorea leprosula TaxID=152421 RepID=A0AAV5KMH8_9ROSI|nr:hypothetical protein SLEP1_g35184 [Rubroshorea leprosula]
MHLVAGLLLSSTSAAASSSGATQASSFRKVVTMEDVGVLKNRMFLYKEDVDTHIVPHLKKEEKRILRRGKKSLDIWVIDKYGTCYAMGLIFMNPHYHLLGAAPLVLGKNFQGNQVIEISLYISY